MRVVEADVALQRHRLGLRRLAVLGARRVAHSRLPSGRVFTASSSWPIFHFLVIGITCSRTTSFDALRLSASFGRSGSSFGGSVARLIG